MPSDTKQILLSGDRYDHLFPRATLKDRTEKRGATVEDTVKFIPKVIRLSRWQIAKYVNQELKGLSTYEACKKLWHFLKSHVAYEHDQNNREQIRTPRRLWHDRKEGVDCDCYSTTIGCALSLLNIPVTFRITKYSSDGRWQHIYPIVPLADGSYITMDCVTDAFNYEKSYIDKQDHPMDLELLDGIDGPDEVYHPMTAAGLINDQEGMAELGKILKKKISLKPKAVVSKVKTAAKKVASTTKTVAKKAAATAKTAGKKVLHAVNRVNPATLALRNGVLAAMKLNMLNVAGNLRYAYLSDADAIKKGADMDKLKKLREVRAKLEKIYFGAGGKPENLRNAILTGKGNANKEVPLNGLEMPYDLSGFDENTPLSELLGYGVYHSENIEGIQGLGDLGEPVTATSVAAASGVIASIAAIIKSIGSVFKKKPAAEGSTPQESNSESNSGTSENSSGDSETNSGSSESSASSNDSSEDMVFDQQNAAEENSEEGAEDNESTTNPPAKTTAAASKTNTEAAAQKTGDFWQDNKTWLKPVAWGVGGIAALVLISKMVKSNNNKSAQLSGLKSKKKHAKTHSPKEAITLM